MTKNIQYYYILSHRQKHTHTHTHIYIYIYNVGLIYASSLISIINYLELKIVQINSLLLYGEDKN